MGQKQSEILKNGSGAPKQLENQKQLKLDVQSIYEADFFMRKFKSEEYAQLEELSIDFNEDIFRIKQNAGEDFNDLLIKFAEKLPQNLKKIELLFICCNELENSSILALAKHFPKRLECLELNFFNCQNITDQGINNIIQYFPKSLEKLSLNLGDCSQITRTSLSSIIQYLTQANLYGQKIKSLELKFSWCGSLTDQLVKLLFKNLDFDIQNLNLQFSQCKGVTYKSMNQATQFVEQMTNPESISLNFSGQNSTSSKEAADKLVKIIPQQLASFNLKFDRRYDEQNKEIFNKHRRSSVMYTASMNSSISNDSE